MLDRTSKRRTLARASGFVSWNHNDVDACNTNYDKFFHVEQDLRADKCTFKLTDKDDEDKVYLCRTHSSSTDCEDASC